MIEIKGGVGEETLNEQLVCERNSRLVCSTYTCSLSSKPVINLQVANFCNNQTVPLKVVWFQTKLEKVFQLKLQLVPLSFPIIV
jgi:hypothetical protein